MAHMLVNAVVSHSKFKVDHKHSLSVAEILPNTVFSLLKLLSSLRGTRVVLIFYFIMYFNHYSVPTAAASSKT